jgi:hypothetical protein
MVKKLVVCAVVLALNPLPLFGQSLRESANEAAIRLAETQRPAAGGRNPYQTPSLVLMGLGGTLTVLSFLAPSGVSCRETGPGLIDIECGTQANKGLLFSGLGAVGLGAYLWMKGDKQRAAQPILTPTPGGIALQHRFRF